VAADLFKVTVELFEVAAEFIAELVVSFCGLRTPYCT